MRKPCLFTLAAAVVALAVPSAADALSAPRLASPGNGARVQQLPALTWNAVRGAAAYEYEVSANSHFSAITLGRGTGKGVSHTYNLAAALEKTVPDGTYYWRVRALTSKDRTGPWSRVRQVVKRWSSAPRITGGDGASVSWPATPLELSWSAVPYANKYIVSVGTDPSLSNLVLGTATRPFETQGVHLVMPASLAPGAYYFAVTPVDAEGRRGTRSPVGSFTWTWPTTTTATVTDLNPEAGPFDDPMFSWAPVPGAARYEVEINASKDWAAGSKWCCGGTTTGTSLAPLRTLANNAYYWRVRAIDARGDAGVWNVWNGNGQPSLINSEGELSVRKAFDPASPTIPGLTLRTLEGETLSGAPATSAPLLTWEPVSGASRYEVELGTYSKAGHYCDWTVAGDHPYHAETATTAWTPLGFWDSLHRPFSEAWPTPQSEVAELPTGTYCVRVNAHSDNDAQQHQVTSEWTYLNGYNNAAFTFTGAATGSSCSAMPQENYLLPLDGSWTPRTPYFTWNPVPGAGSYYVVVARDAGFTEVVDIGFTDITAYAPRLVSKRTPLSDETTSYYWAVMPAVTSSGGVVCSDPLHDNPQSFNKSSIPTTPLEPAPGAEISTQPTFRWNPAENARTYTLQVAQDPTFGAPIDNVTIDATAYTSSSTYPADTVLYWRVRPNDWNGQGLNWSATRTFIRRLPAPTLAAHGPTTIFGPEPIAWSPVQGAVAYEVHVEQGDGRSNYYTFESPAASVTEYYGTGIAHYQVRAEFPSGVSSKVGGAESARGESQLILAAPKGARGVRSGGRLIVTWNPEPDAKQYEVEIAKTSGFATPLEGRKVDGTSWAPDINLKRKQYRGTLYWRVAPVDQRGGVGSFASGAFATPRSHRKKH